MYLDSLSRILITCVLALTLAACGGGGGGGGTLIGTPEDPDNGDGTTGSGSIVLTISGLVDENGDPDNVLAGNEFATLTAEVIENGAPANVIVLFETNIGRLVPESAQSTGGSAIVEITGDGTAGAATVIARATLSGGLEVTDEIVVQMSSDAPTLTFVDAAGQDVSTVELGGAETSTVTAQLRDWDGTPLVGVGVNFSFEFDDAESLTSSITTGATDQNGNLAVTLTGSQLAGTGVFNASATFSGFTLADSITANGLGVDAGLNNLTLDAIDVGADGALAGNEKTMAVARVVQNGQPVNGIVIQFSTNGTGGLLGSDSAISSNDGASDGVSMVQLIGDGTAGTLTLTATATLSNGITVEATQIVQTSEEGPTLTLEVRNAAGLVVTSFGANQDLTLEATIVDFDGAALDADDAGVNVSFNVGNLGVVSKTSDVTEFAVCPVNGIKQNSDCAFVSFTSNAVASVGDITATASMASLLLETTVQVTNTGLNSGTGDQDSFSITRNSNGSIAIDDVFALEGDQFNGESATIEVDLADFFNNPVPDDTLISFTTELGDIDDSCQTNNGSCSVTFTTGDPRTPLSTGVSFKNLNDDNCPSRLIVNERQTITSGAAVTDYRVASIKRVARTTGAVLATTTYKAVAAGIECLGAPCTNGTAVDITYERLWLDEEDDAASTYAIAQPGQATEPFLAVKGTPCQAAARNNIEQITGSINPNGTTGVTGVGTQFELELAVGDRLRVQNEIRTITAIASDTALTVDAAFTDDVNDVSPQRIAAPGYQGGMGQPYGARSAILAYALGEESFNDANGNNEYDVGERFGDLTEVFIDKNGDGVLGDFEGDSASAGAIGPYRDAGNGADPIAGKRDKSSPFCYGPKTIVGESDSAGSSSEQQIYCYQDGGEEELFIDEEIDGAKNGVMDLGNLIYNGSRCLNPMQDADGDGTLEEVCTTDLVNISAQTEILMAGSSGYFGFRTSSGGDHGTGELVSSVQRAGGAEISNTAPSPEDWVNNGGVAVPSITVQKGADVNTALLAGGSRDVELFTLSDVFTTSNATWTVSFDVLRTDGNTGTIEIFASGILQTITGSGTAACGDEDETCTATFTVIAPGNLLIASADDTDPLGAEISNFSITGVTTGLGFDYEIVNGETVNSNDNNVVLTQFDVGDATTDLPGTPANDGATQVFPGVSERLGNGGAVPSLSTSIQSLRLFFTDEYNGQLPNGTVIKVESDNSAGCTIASVNGVAVNSNEPGADTGSVHSGEVTVGSDVATSTSVSLSTGFGAGPISVFATTPRGVVTSRTISCEL